LAEELPRLGAELAKMLRDTARLRQVAGLLRDSQKAIDSAVTRWPDLRKTLAQSAVLLRSTQRQIGHALENREMFEASLDVTIALVRAITTALPVLSDELEANLSDQEQSLRHLEHSIDEVSASLPPVADTAATVLAMTRLLMVLVGGVFALHGGFVLLSARRGPLQMV
jgi:hypothetical protein